MSEEEKQNVEEQEAENEAAPESPQDASSEASPGDQDDVTLPNENALGAIYDVPVQVSAVLGKANLHVNQLLKLGRGAVVELDRKVGEAIDVFVNNRLVARGEIVVMDDDHIGVTMTEIIKSDTSD